MEFIRYVDNLVLRLIIGQNRLSTDEFVFKKTELKSTDNIGYKLKVHFSSNINKFSLN